MNGNKVVKLTFPEEKIRGFSIQTDGVLPKTHKSNKPCKEEIIDYVKRNGTLYQKEMFKNLFGE